MSTLKEFLKANPVDNLTEKAKISDRLKDFEFTIKAIGSKDCKAYDDQKHHIEPAENPVVRKIASKEEFFHGEKQAKIQSPPDEIPLCPMPEARGKPHCENIKKQAASFYAVAAEGNVDIVSEPCAK